MKLINTIKERLSFHNDKDAVNTRAPPDITITEEVVYRYRKQRGVNLGSWFVLERWITDGPFCSAHAPGQSDLDVARGADARRILENHWDTWIRESDIAWLAERGVNTIRIPIGYYHLCGVDPSVLRGTAFHEFEYVFQGAWTRIEQAIETAEKYGIGVLIDLHAAPGKQNNDAHSGTSEAATFFKDKHSRKHTTFVLCSLVRHLKPHKNIVGVELLNEPHPSSDEELQKWYTNTIQELHHVDPDMPIYIGECWRTDTYVQYVEKLSRSLGEGKHALIVLDHHLYRCFTSSDISTKAFEHTRALSDSASGIQKAFESATERLGRAGAGLIVGEWSGALNPGSLEGKPREQLEYVHAQLSLYEKWCAGWFFWTYKKKSENDPGWSFRDAVERGVMPNWVSGIKVDIGKWEKRGNVNSSVEKGAKQKAFDQHVAYWSQYPGNYEHWRFEEGFDLGWNDMYSFVESVKPKASIQRWVLIPEIGFKAALARCRSEYIGKNYWEYEHGYMQGVEAATQQFMNSLGENSNTY